MREWEIWPQKEGKEEEDLGKGEDKMGGGEERGGEQLIDVKATNRAPAVAEKSNLSAIRRRPSGTCQWTMEREERGLAIIRADRVPLFI